MTEVRLLKINTLLTCSNYSINISVVLYLYCLYATIKQPSCTEVRINSKTDTLGSAQFVANFRQTKFHFHAQPPVKR